MFPINLLAQQHFNKKKHWQECHWKQLVKKLWLHMWQTPFCQTSLHFCRTFLKSSINNFSYAISEILFSSTWHLKLITFKIQCHGHQNLKYHNIHILFMPLCLHVYSLAPFPWNSYQCGALFTVYYNFLSFTIVYNYRLKPICFCTQFVRPLYPIHEWKGDTTDPIQYYLGSGSSQRSRSSDLAVSF